MDSHVRRWLFPLKPGDLPGQFKVSCGEEEEEKEGGGGLTTEFPQGP